MHLFVYIAYGLILLAFLVLGGFATRHAFNYSYISPRIKPVTLIFVVVSVILIAISFYFLMQLQF